MARMHFAPTMVGVDIQHEPGGDLMMFYTNEQHGIHKSCVRSAGQWEIEWTADRLPGLSFWCFADLAEALEFYPT